MNTGSLSKNSTPDSFQRYVSEYVNTAAHNEMLHDLFRTKTNETPLLREHRDWIEQHKWGYGFRALHALWLVMLQHLSTSTQFNKPLKLLEIGVFKGQVLSLWALIAQHLSCPVSIYGISDFKGNIPTSTIGKFIKLNFHPRYRKLKREGNLHPQLDYKKACAQLFEQFDVNQENITLIEGESTDSTVIARVSQETFSLVYVDGNHSYDAVVADLANYGSLLQKHGLLVVDDAALFLPGEGYWKGLKAVSNAAELLDKDSFRNIFNLGHVRVFEKL